MSQPEQQQQEQQKSVEQLAESLGATSIEATSSNPKHGSRPAKKEKAAKVVTAVPAVEDHAKDRYGLIPVNFNRMTHTGIKLC